MSDTPQPPQSVSVQEQIDRLDALRAQGREAMAKVDQFYRDHGIEPGIGEKMLLSEAVPERHRAIFSKLLAEFGNMERRIQEFDPNSTKAAPRPVAARAVGNRYRI